MSERRFWQSTAAIWAGTSVLLILIAWSAIAAWSFPDPDDQLRLLQVRDWLGGQSWFDLTQYRLNAPAGVPMHWSRLVDLPIAAIILLCRPLLGQTGAEHVALVVVPLLTLGVVMALLAAIGRRLLGDPGEALMGVCIAPLCIEILHQLRPMRIDHHGWQMALALVATWALIGRDRRHAGWIAGAAIAAWLSISLEGLPMIAAILALVALRWALRPTERTLLITTALATTIGAVAIFAVTHTGAAWRISVCDAASPVYLAMLGIATIGIVALTAVPIRSLAGRVAGLGVVGIAAVAPVPWLAPQCLAGPFGHLDPLVRHFWYLNVLEGLPLWYQTPVGMVGTIGLPLIGLVGTIKAVRRTAGEARDRWLTIAFLLAAAALAAVFVQRSGGVANLLAIPGAVVLLHPLLLRARAIASVPGRLAATLGVFLAAAPGMTAGVAIAAVASDPRVAKVHQALTCLDGNEMRALDALPRGNVLAPLDISPTIILLTHHEAVASGHHRGAAAMRDVIAAFTGDATQARAIAVRHRIDYVAFCPGLAEIMTYEGEAPHGFLAQLDAGRAPSWLTPVPLSGSPAKVWRVR